jgi:TonB family protein
MPATSILTQNKAQAEPLPEPAGSQPRQTSAPRPMAEPGFRLLPSRRMPWKAYGAGMGLQILLLAGVVIWGLQVARQQFVVRRTALLMFVPQPRPVKIREVRVRRLHILHLLHTPHAPAAIVRPRRLRPKLVLPRRLRLSMPAVVLPEVPTPKLARLVRRVHFNRPQPAVVDPPRTVVDTGVFHSNHAIRHPLPERSVQTGGFGAAHGITAARYARHGNLEATGAFDLPIGPGQGNGTGGAHGRAGRLAAAGFGVNIAAAGGGPPGRVTAVGFGNGESAARRRVQNAPQPPSPTRAVEILYKPRPQYTPQARAHKLQGSIWLAVVFGANGQVRVLRVLRGLGDGLNAAARQAAASIRFHPARRGGRAVDFPARIRIRFRLAH